MIQFGFLFKGTTHEADVEIFDYRVLPAEYGMFMYEPPEVEDFSAQFIESRSVLSYRQHEEIKELAHERILDYLIQQQE